MSLVGRLDSGDDIARRTSGCCCRLPGHNASHSFPPPLSPVERLGHCFPCSPSPAPLQTRSRRMCRGPRPPSCEAPSGRWSARCASWRLRGTASWRPVSPQLPALTHRPDAPPARRSLARTCLPRHSRSQGSLPPCPASPPPPACTCAAGRPAAVACTHPAGLPAAWPAGQRGRAAAAGPGGQGGRGDRGVQGGLGWRGGGGQHREVPMGRSTLRGAIPAQRCCRPHPLTRHTYHARECAHMRTCTQTDTHTRMHTHTHTGMCAGQEGSRLRPRQPGRGAGRGGAQGWVPGRLLPLLLAECQPPPLLGEVPASRRRSLPGGVPAHFRRVPSGVGSAAAARKRMAPQQGVHGVCVGSRARTSGVRPSAASAAALPAPAGSARLLLSRVRMPGGLTCCCLSCCCLSCLPGHPALGLLLFFCCRGSLRFFFRVVCLPSWHTP